MFRAFVFATVALIGMASMVTASSVDVDVGFYDSDPPHVLTVIDVLPAADVANVNAVSTLPERLYRSGSVEGEIAGSKHLERAGLFNPQPGHAFSGGDG